MNHETWLETFIGDELTPISREIEQDAAAPVEHSRVHVLVKGLYHNLYSAVAMHEATVIVCEHACD